MSKAIALVQVQLRSGETLRMCWVEPKVKTGDVITLKDEEPDREWTVEWVSSEEREKSELRKGWPVGGLS